MPSNVLIQAPGGAIALLFGLVALVVTVAMVGWTYFDAQERSPHPAFLWAVVVFLAPLLGLVLYLLLGRGGGQHGTVG